VHNEVRKQLKGTKMVKALASKKRKVNALIKDADSGWEEEDRKLLMNMSDKQLDKLAVKAKADDEDTEEEKKAKEAEAEKAKAEAEKAKAAEAEKAKAEAEKKEPVLQNGAITVEA